MRPDVHDKYLKLVLDEAEAEARRDTAERARRREERARQESRMRITTERAEHTKPPKTSGAFATRYDE